MHVELLTALLDRPPGGAEKAVAAGEAIVGGAVSGRQTVVPDSGHFLHVDRPDLVATAIVELSTMLAGRTPSA